MDIPFFDFNYWIVQTIAMLLTVWILPRLQVTSIFGATGMAAAIAFVNSAVWDASLFFSVPTSVTTNALFLLFANGLIFWVLVKLLPGIEIDGILPAILAPVVFTVFSVLVNQWTKGVDWLAVGKSLVQMLEQGREYFLKHRK